MGNFLIVRNKITGEETIFIEELILNNDLGDWEIVEKIVKEDE